MRARNTRPRLRGVVTAAWGILLLAGCGDAVPEDRTINMAPSGNRAALQHGADGIFVADPQSGELRKVFDPDKSIVAVSSPLWLPDETQALFTTARDEPAPNDNRLKSVDRGRTAAAVDWNDAPEGRLFYPLPIVYTCWLLERGPDGGFKQPTALFEAHCGHTGYVAANCAVRRSARGDKILYIDHEPPTGHAVWTFDRKTGQKSRVFPPGGVSAPDYVVADYLPDGASIVCTAGRYGSAVIRDSGASEEEKVPPSASDKLDGIWIRPPDSDRWWHVAESQVRPEENGPGGLSGALARRPVFTKDGARLAFVRIRFDAGKPPTALLFRGKISEHKVEQIFKTDQGISDPHWSPTGSRLGFVTMGPEPTLTVIDAQGQLERPAPGEFVRSFLGWNAAGNELAYVVAEHTSQPTVKTWSELLSVDPLARDALVVSATPRDVKDRDVKGSDAKGGDAKSGVAGSGQPRILLSGMRLTFPQWSPARDTISVWGTFTPTHRSWADTAVAHGLAMRAGDPAAAIDAASGSVRWLAINGDEQAQVGHAFQIKRDFAGTGVVSPGRENAPQIAAVRAERTVARRFRKRDPSAAVRVLLLALPDKIRCRPGSGRASARFRTGLPHPVAGQRNGRTHDAGADYARIVRSVDAATDRAANLGDSSPGRGTGLPLRERSRRRNRVFSAKARCRHPARRRPFGRTARRSDCAFAARSVSGALNRISGIGHN